MEAIRQTLLNTPGVLGLHELRTRKMADNALVDAHILVNPRISVSEGHHIAESARHAVLNQHHVLDVMVHIDPEDDMQAGDHAKLPSRPRLLELLADKLGNVLLGNRVVFHYLEGRLDVELHLPSDQFTPEGARTLQMRCNELVKDDPLFRAIHVHLNHAQ